MSDSLISDGRNLRIFNLIDDYNRECLAIDADFVMPSLRVIISLEQVIGWRGKPFALRCDNGPEYLYSALMNWANQHCITLRYEWLDMHHFDSVEQAHTLAMAVQQ